jgi:hypothetical protein
MLIDDASPSDRNSHIQQIRLNTSIVSLAVSHAGEHGTCTLANLFLYSPILFADVLDSESLCCSLFVASLGCELAKLPYSYIYNNQRFTRSQRRTY